MFKQVCENAQGSILSSEAAQSDKSGAQKEPVDAGCNKAKRSLIQMFKNDESFWTCTECYVKNIKEFLNCLACGTLFTTANPANLKTPLQCKCFDLSFLIQDFYV